MPPKRKNSSATQQPPAKRTRSSLSKRPNSNLGRTNQTSSNQTHEPSTRGSSRRRRAAATPLRSTASDSPPLPQSPTPLPSHSSQNCGTFIPHEVLNQLSNALQHLTSSIQANNRDTPTTGNAEPPRTIEDGTSNVESPLSVQNSTPNVHNTDALSEASGQQQTGTPFSSTATAVHDYMGRTILPGAHPDVSLPPVPPRTKDKIISGEFIDLATLLPKAMFSGSTELETSRSLTVQLTTSNDLALRPQSTKKITSFSSWMEAWNIYLAILIDHSPARAPQLVAYQRIITSASAQYPLAAWLNYDTQFRTLAASDPTLRWDTRHTDLWLQCVTSPSSAIRWPCSHCGATNHYPTNCPFRPHTVYTYTHQ